MEIIEITSAKSVTTGSLIEALMFATGAPCTYIGKPNFEKVYGDDQGATYKVRSIGKYCDVWRNDAGWEVVEA
jgi:hypothetical protein